MRTNVGSNFKKIRIHKKNVNLNGKCCPAEFKKPFTGQYTKQFNCFFYNRII